MSSHQKQTDSELSKHGADSAHDLFVLEQVRKESETSLQVSTHKVEHTHDEKHADTKWNPISWMARNSVASNLLMFSLIFGGLLFIGKIKKEVFPEFTLDVIQVSVAYPGASPSEIELGISTLIEEAVRGLDGVKKVKSTSTEGISSVIIELLDGVNSNTVLADTKAAIDRIINFPVDAEKPITSLIVARNIAMSLIIHGPFEHQVLRQVAEDVRDDLLKEADITLVEMKGIPPREVAVEISQNQLRSHQITLGQVANSIRQASIDLPGGGLKTRSGETLIRTKERRDFGQDFKQIILKSNPQGARLYLEDVAEVYDTFQDVDIDNRFNGQSAVMLDVFRVGRQDPLSIASAVKSYMENVQLADNISLSIWNDRSKMYKERADLLKRNALMGLALVFIVLGLFLEIKLAFWVMLGIPISFCGAFLLMPGMDVSINMISMFAFLLTLGIVVDDAIVVGENIYEKRLQGMAPMQAAIEGAKEVGAPVVFAVLTTIAAFSPLLFVPGASGKFLRVIPAIVICVLLISLIESLFVLPAHLAHSAPSTKGILFGIQSKISWLLNLFIQKLYQPVLRFCTRYRYFSFAFAMAAFFVCIALVMGSHLKFTFMPKLEGDNVIARARLPIGTPIQETIKVQEQLLKTLQQVLAKHGGEEQISLGIMSQVGSTATKMGPNPGKSSSGSHVVDVSVRLVSMDKRDVSSGQVGREWREVNQNLIGLRSLTFGSSLGSVGGDPIDILMSHKDAKILEDASEMLSAELKEYQGIIDIKNGFEGGKKQINMKLKPSALRLGLTEQEVARQVRHAFFGAEALRQQRGRDEVRVMVRLPKLDRKSLASLEQLIIRTPQKGETPLSEIVTLQWGHAFAKIEREEGRRVIHVTADVDQAVANANKVLARVRSELMPQMMSQYPGLSYSLEGQQREQGNTMASLKTGFLMAMGLIFALLAIPFNSYVQPLIIMMAIPFGFIGATLGHLLLGYDLSLISMMGIVALAGVVVNDSLILIVSINDYKDKGYSSFEAVIQGGMRRFRPILLTSLTTFMGLVPMISEPSVQARFLIPMAISLGFGVLFATVLILLVVPATYMIIEDLRGLFSKDKSIEHTLVTSSDNVLL
jgi:multidrug efflux pump subunit AcrB